MTGCAIHLLLALIYKTLQQFCSNFALEFAHRFYTLSRCNFFFFPSMAGLVYSLPYMKFTKIFFTLSDTAHTKHLYVTENIFINTTY